jgi:hypothetical protein
MKQSPSERNISASCQEVTHSVRNPKFHYCFQSSQALVSILRQINPVHALPSYFFQIYSNIIPHLRLYLPWPQPFIFTQQNSVGIYFLSHIHATHHACYSPASDHPVAVGEENEAPQYATFSIFLLLAKNASPGANSISQMNAERHTANTRKMSDQF